MRQTPGIQRSPRTGQSTAYELLRLPSGDTPTSRSPHPAGFHHCAAYNTASVSSSIAESSHNIGNNEAIPHVGDGFAFQTNSGRSGGRKRLMLLIRPHTHTEQEIASATGRRNNGASARVQSSAPRPSTRPGSTATPRAPSSATRQYPWHYPLAG